MIILGVETSCDETSVSIIKASKKKIEVLSNVVSSQVYLHAKWGGVVPNLAAREHLKNIIPVLEESLSKASLKKEDIHLISVTQGPGLIPALLVGTNFAKTLAYTWQKPLIGIHHIEGHIYANFIGTSDQEQVTKDKENETRFPLLALVVSGGHTQLIFMKDNLQYEIIGETQDDAVGEAFDKVARILGLGYPGGPIVSKLADSSNPKNFKHSVQLPRPMINSKNFDFSFSGLKTAVLYTVKDYRSENKLSEEDNLPGSFVAEVAHEFQQAATEVLVTKTLRAAREYSPKSVVLAGGVSANQELDKQMRSSLSKSLPQVTYQKPNITYSLDNAAMIAIAGYYRWENMNEKQKSEALNNWKNLQADAGLKIAKDTSVDS